MLLARDTCPLSVVTSVTSTRVVTVYVRTTMCHELLHEHRAATGSACMITLRLKLCLAVISPDCV